MIIESDFDLDTNSYVEHQQDYKVKKLLVAPKDASIYFIFLFKEQRRLKALALVSVIPSLTLVNI